MEFLWTKEIVAPEFPALEGERETEVLVIGGGMAGVLCALKLQEAGVDYLLVEGSKIGSGMTRGTTAVLTAQHDTLYQDLLDKIGRQKAGLYLHANLQAVARFAQLCKEIPCEFEERPSLMYSLRDRTRMEREVAVLRALDYQADFLTQTVLPFEVAGAVRYPGMAQFHPLRFLYGAAKGLHIFENTFVRKLEGTVAVTDRGRIRAQKIIVATHFPFINLHGLYFAKLYQKRSFVIALENAPELGCTIEDEAKDGVYLRNYRDLLLIGKGERRTGAGACGFEAPRAFARKYFPLAREKFAWANQDCVSLDGVPYIGAYSPALPQVYVATGFNLWGMSNSMVASEILTDLVLGRENPYAAAFSPDRCILRAQLFSNLGHALWGWVKPTPKRCTHMGCALKYNAVEGSFDCPCHGSRFTAKGDLLNNPAMRDRNAK